MQEFDKSIKFTGVVVVVVVVVLFCCKVLLLLLHPFFEMQAQHIVLSSSDQAPINVSSLSAIGLCLLSIEVCCRFVLNDSDDAVLFCLGGWAG